MKWNYDMKFKYLRKPEREVLLVAEGGKASPLTRPTVFNLNELPKADTLIPELLDVPDLRVYKYHNVALLPKHVILDETLQYVYPNSFKKHRHHRHMGLVHLGDDKFAPRRPVGPTQPELIPGVSYYLDCEFPNVYGHFLLEVWPQLWAQHKLDLDNLTFVTSTELPEYVLQVLEFLGVPRNRIIQINAITRCETLIVPAPAVLARRYVHPVAREVFAKIAQMDSLMDDDERAKVEKLGPNLYFSRSGVSGRGLVNESEVEQLVASRGFEVVHTQDYSIPAQMGMLRNAKNIVGPGGSGMHNAVFGNHLKVLILASEGWFPIADILLSQGHYDLFYVFGERLMKPEDGSRSQTPWQIDLADVERGLDQFFGRSTNY